jgi:hypothetical protein
MSRASVVSLFAGVSIAVAAAGPALAQPQRTFVASYGNDANVDCPRSAPCRSFTIAGNAVAAGGEVVALDSAGYGPFGVDKPLTVTSEGVHAAITAVAGGPAILVQLGPTGVVVLRNLRVQGVAGATNGIEVEGNGGALHVENVVVGGPFTTGIDIDFPGEAFVKDTVVRDATTGISVAGAAATLDRVRTDNNSTGLEAKPNSSVTLRDSISSGNSLLGYRAVGGIGGTTPGVLRLENCLSAHNNTGVATLFGATAYVSDSTIAFNGVGLSSGIGSTGNLVSFGNNVLANNTTAGAFTSTVALQ